MTASPRRSRNRRAHTARPAAMVQILETRIVFSASPIGGVGNNVQHTDWGRAGVDLLRTAEAAYSDGISSPAGETRASAREISNAIADQGGQDIISDRYLSAMIYAWGQFIDHDIDLTLTGNSETIASTVPTGDPYFDPNSTGTQTISTRRSVFDPATGTDASNPRQQINSITAFLDGSMVYGSDAATAASLRTFSGGKLKTSTGNLLPTDANGNFLAGDIRVNENVELTALQTLFVREHNYWAGKIASQNRGLNDEQIYQKARERVIAEIQSITYNQWLPALLGKGALDRYDGYDSSVNPGIATEFSTASFRVGHSLLGDDVEFLNNNGIPIRDEISLAEAFFNPSLVKETGIDPILKYLASDPASEVDTKVVDSVRNFLFGAPGSGGLDLATLNILRGRDHGLADYNTVREAYGLPRVTSFSEITSDAALASKLEELYGSVDNIDLWVGGLAEDHVAGASVGETIRAVVSDQFERLRDGDRFWYQTQYGGKELQEIERTTLTDIIRRNTTLTNLQQDSFFFKSSISGTVFTDTNRNGRQDGKELGAAGILVTLVDRTTKEVVATATTDARGQYTFGVAEGLRTGIYEVRATLSDGTSGLVTKPISITQGNQFLKATDLALAAPKPTTPPKPIPAPKSVPSLPGTTNQLSQEVVNSTPAVASTLAGGQEASSAKSSAATAGSTSASTAMPTSPRRALPVSLDSAFLEAAFRSFRTDLT